MTKNVGDTVYLYVARNGKFFIHEGVITEVDYRRKRVIFKDRSTPRSVPKEFGVIDKAGFSLWLADRNDELAKQIFVKHIENGIAELQELVNRKTEMLNVLKSREV